VAVVVTRTFAALLDDRAASLVGRERERAALLRLVERDEPLVAFVHGVGGVGKSALVRAFSIDARERAATVVLLDGSSFEPTELGFAAELGRHLKFARAAPAELGEALGGAGDRVVLAIDTFERLRLIDDWLRHTFLPVLPDNVRVLLAGREPPGAGWLGSFGELLLPVALENLSADHAHEVLRRAGVSKSDSRRLNQLAHGHPLSLQLAAAARRAKPDRPLDEVAIAPVVGELTRMFLDELEPDVRRALDAAAVVRRTTLSLLAAMLPDEPAGEAFDVLRRLPFVELSPDGLMLHDTVREVLASRLRAADPATYRQLRAAAWRQLRNEDRTRKTKDLWRYTADMLFLVENELLHEALFPSGPAAAVVQEPRPQDLAGMLEISTDFDPPESTESLRRLMATAPHLFRVAIGPDGTVNGYLMMCEPRVVPKREFEQDPLLAMWREHLRENPVPREQHVLFSRHYLCRDVGEGLSPAQSALWIAAIRDVMAMRPRLRRIYVKVQSPEFVDHRRWLGFEPFPDPVLIGDLPYTPMLLDMGPSSVDGWLSVLVGNELAADANRLDLDVRQLVVDGRRIDLSKLECDVLEYLRQREGQAVRREALLRDVWGYDWTGGSNVIDVVISSLRKKLATHADALETVRGVGYRMRPLA